MGELVTLLFAEAVPEAAEDPFTAPAAAEAVAEDALNELRLPLSAATAVAAAPSKVTL